MPELPEVETVRRRLATCLPGLVRARSDACTTRPVSPQPAGASSPAAARPPRAQPAAARQVPHRRLRRSSAGGAPAHDRPARFCPTAQDAAAQASVDDRLRRRRPRRPLLLRYAPLRTRLGAARRRGERPFFAHLGVEPLDDEFTPARLRALLAQAARAAQGVPARPAAHRRHRQHLRRRGALPRRLHPLRPAGSVGPREAQRLHAAIRDVLELAIEHEGSSVESFVDPAGDRAAASRRSSTSTSAPASPAASAARRSAASRRRRPRHALLPALPAAAPLARRPRPPR